MTDYSFLAVLLFITLNLVPTDKKAFELYLHSPEKEARVTFKYDTTDKNWEFSDESGQADKFVFSVDKKAKSITLITAGGKEVVSLKKLLKLTGKEKWHKITQVAVISQENQEQTPIKIFRIADGFTLKQDTGYLSQFKEVKVKY